MNEVNHIEEEMDMWTLEFGKYVTVQKVQTLEEVSHSYPLKIKYL